MDRTIYTQIIARLKSATAAGYFTDASQIAPVHYAWFEDQFDNAMLKENVEVYNFDFPAVLIQFSKETEFSGSNARKKFSGEVTLHIGQDKRAIDGQELATSHADFKLLLAYVESFIALLDGYKLPCTARLVVAGVERDHVNHPLMVDRVRFTFEGSWNKPTVTEVVVP